MKAITLKRIELTNFKGQAHRVEEFTEGENFIYGANATGKTSVFDAFLWLLFGKDSHGQSEEKAKIKMLDKNGQPIWHTDNSVEATFIVDGEELSIKRTYQEKWRKPKGQAEAVYDGQTTIFSWNGNEKISAAEYKKRVAALIDENLFKLVTDPNFFASLDVKKRREIVLAMAGDVTEAEIKAANYDLEKFNPGDNVEETRSIAMSSRTRTIKERDNYPARIDEQMQIITDKKAQIDALNLEDKEILFQQLKSHEEALKAVDNRLLDVQGTIDAVVKANNERIKALNNLEAYKMAKQKALDDDIKKYNENINQAKENIIRVENQISKNVEEMQKHIGYVENAKKQLDDIKAKINAVRAEEMPTFEEAVCPVCHRPLEAHDQEAHLEKLKANWVQDKADRIERLQEEGDSIFNSAKASKKYIEFYDDEKLKLEKVVEELKETASLPLKEIEAINFDDDPQYQEMLAAIPQEVSVEDQIKQTREAAEAEKLDLRAKINDVKAQLTQHERKAMLEFDIKAAENRISKLEAEQLGINQKIADQERIIYLCDLWTKTKVELLNKRVENKFKLVKFKMFNYTQEGNAVPTCEITVNGVDYTALNTAAKINAGLDIIKALINYYGVKAPIFIDNRESVTMIDAPETQIINLSVK